MSKIGGKWKGEILWYLSEGTKRHGELKKLLSGITQKVLTEQLRQLEEDGLIQRKIYPEVPPKVEYSITEYGISIVPMLNMMCEFAAKHHGTPECKKNK